MSPVKATPNIRYDDIEWEGCKRFFIETLIYDDRTIRPHERKKKKIETHQTTHLGLD